MDSFDERGGASRRAASVAGENPSAAAQTTIATTVGRCARTAAAEGLARRLQPAAHI
jgi:hypothetical protein